MDFLNDQRNGKMSQHECLVIEIKLEPHTNADSLSIVHVFGYQCVVRTSDWKDGDLGVYVPPDSVVPNTLEFEFLKRPNSKHWNHIRVMRLRGEISMGLLMPAPEGAKIGDNLMEKMGIIHYEPPEPMEEGGQDEPGPDGWYPKYDVEHLLRFNELFEEGEPVVVTEKIHGASGRFAWMNGRMWVGSRTKWKKEDEDNLFWQTLIQNPWIKEWCQLFSEKVLYGEVYGQVSNLKYGTSKGQFRFAAFDIWDKSQWASYDEFKLLRKGIEDFQFVPELYKGPFEAKTMAELAEGKSFVPGANHIREGIVVRPVNERVAPEIGRVQLKIISNAYLSKDWGD